MLQWTAFVLVFSAVLGSYATDPRVGWAACQRQAVAVRLVALLAIGGAFRLWHSVEPGLAAFFSVTLALLVSASLCALLAPLARKVPLVLAVTGWAGVATWSLL